MNSIVALAIAIGSWFSLPGGSWTPNTEDVAAARQQLEPYVTRQASIGKMRLPDWSSYTFQYQGQTFRGDKVILINAFCRTPPATAATDMVVVFDGGPCYFRARWDPAEKIFLDVVFNGQA
ncbi:hypothetical protein [Xanthomonas sacchari]|uniref:hypothetical protein n=1 Tax=Xanthomonas sacchari TaxID=56458 RepID=UPI00352863A6